VSEHDALQERHRSTPDHELTLTFDELDTLLQGLPDSARRPGRFWSNDVSSNPAARRWLATGRRVLRVDFHRKWVLPSGETPAELIHVEANGACERATAPGPGGVGPSHRTESFPRR
jgi:hypothetical protein